MPLSTIASLAILKANYDNPEYRKDYLDMLIPFMIEAIRCGEHDEIVLGQLQNDIQDYFGLDIPQNTIKTLLRRLRRADKIKTKHGAYVRSPHVSLDTGFSEIQQDIVSKYERLIRGLIDYVKDEFQHEWSAKETDRALLAFLNEYQIQILTSNQQHSIIPRTSLVDTISGNPHFLVGAFVNHIYQDHSVEFDYLLTVIQGNMLANAIFLPDPYQTRANFSNVGFYFDTTFLIYALGYAGKPRRAPAEELLNYLYETGGKLYCFQQTVSEIQGVLDACAGLLVEPSRAYGAAVDTIEHFVTSGCTVSDIELFIATLERDLKSLRIEVVSKPEYVPRFLIGEQNFEDYLGTCINYSTKSAAQHDVDSISAIMRLRGGQSVSRIEKAKAIFITTNTALARASRQFMAEAYSGCVSPCITDYALTNIVWLMRASDRPELTAKRLIADAYAATQPSKSLLNRYVSEINKLKDRQDISEEQYYYLRYSLSARASLMDVTEGDERAFTEGTLSEIVQLMESRREDEVTARAEDKASAQIEQRIEQQRNNVRANATPIARILSRSVRIIVIILLLVGFAMTPPWDTPPWQASGAMQAFRWILALIWILAFFYGVGSLIWGFALNTHIRKLEIWLANKITELVLSMTQQRQS